MKAPEPVRAAASGRKHEARSIEVMLKAVGVPLAIGVAAAIWLMPTPSGLSIPGQKALALFGGIFVLYLTEALPLAISSLLVVPVAALGGVVSLKGALDGFSSSSVYLILGAFILAAAMVKTRLAERITDSSLAASAIANADHLASPQSISSWKVLVPSTTARKAILLPVCRSTSSVVPKHSSSRFAVNLLLRSAITNATISAGVLTATVPNPVTNEILAKAGGRRHPVMRRLLMASRPLSP